MSHNSRNIELITHLPVFTELPKLPALDILDTEPEKILHRRLVKKGSAVITQVLVKWKQLDDDSATWDDWSVLTSKFPAVLAWGQASSSLGGDVMTAVTP